MTGGGALSGGRLPALVLAVAGLVAAQALQELRQAFERLLAELRLAGLRGLRGLAHLFGDFVLLALGEFGGLLLHGLRELLERLRGVALLLELCEELFQLRARLGGVPGFEGFGGGAGLLAGGEGGGQRGHFLGGGTLLAAGVLHFAQHGFERG